jgi:hypothetical protein
MADFEVKLRKNFTVMSNHHLRNKDLSLKAKGLLSYMLSLPDDWDYSIGGLAANNKEGRAAVRSALCELEEAGYLIHRQCRSEDGGFAGNQYIVYEVPHAKTEDEPLCENCTTDEIIPPLCDFTSAENPLSENRTQLNTNLPSTNLTKPPKSPRRGKGRRSEKDDLSETLFQRFWDKYPNHKGKQAAKKAWDKLHPSIQTCREMADALAWQATTWEWTHEDGRYVPMASTWLNQKRWLEDPSAYHFEEQGSAKTSLAQKFVEQEDVPRW